MMKYTIRRKLDWKNVPILWEKYDCQFPKFSPYDGFSCIFPYYGKLMLKHTHFPYDEVYHKMGIGREKSTHTMGEVWLPISQVLAIRWVLLHFPMLLEVDRHTNAFLIWWDLLIFSCELVWMNLTINFKIWLWKDVIRSMAFSLVRELAGIQY